MGFEQNNGTSNSPSEQKPCINNCGFFGNSEKRDFCSRCYTNLSRQEGLAASAVTTAVNPPSPGAAGPSNAAKRCGSCNKKVGLIGFVCKCGTTFCGKHRYLEMHQCTYDFKTSGREAISKANPLVKGDRVPRF